jgi:hypothetical protein
LRLAGADFPNESSFVNRQIDRRSPIADPNLQSSLVNP